MPQVIVDRMATFRCHPARALAVATAIAVAVGCSARPGARAVPRPRVVPHARWEAQPPLGYAADATRHNRRGGDSLAFRDLTVTVLGTSVDSAGARPLDVVRLRLALGDAREEREAREGSAFNWRGFHVAVVAIYGPGELGA